MSSSKSLGLAVSFGIVSLFFLPWIFSQEPRWGLIYILAGVGLFFIRSINIPAAIGLVFIAWCLLSLSWSSDAKEGLIGVSSMMALWVVFVLFSKWGNESTLFWVALVGMPLAIAFNWIFPGQEAGFGNQNWTTDWLLLVMPFVLQRWWGIPIALAAAVYLVFFNDSFTEAGVVVGLIFLWSLLKHRLTALLLIGAAGALLTVGPDFLGLDLLSSFKSRIEIWINTFFLWFEAPLFGHGLGSFNVEYPRFQEKHLELLPGWGTQLYPIVVYVGSAHNEPLQALAEVGLVGLSLAGWFLWAVWRRKASLPAATGSLMVAGILCLFSFPLQNPSSAFVIAASLGLISQGSREFSLGSAFSRWSGPCTRMPGSSLKRSISSRRRRSGPFRPIWMPTTPSRGRRGPEGN